MLESNQAGVIAWITLAAFLFPAGRCESSPELPHARPAMRQDTLMTNVEQHLRFRTPAVAGLFYPSDKASLSKTVDSLLAGAPAHWIPRVRALICPHAAYPFSGPIAAAAYKTLAGRDIQTVVILAPSHYARFKGASIPDANAFQTPLGIIPLSPKARPLANAPSFVLEPRCPVQRPDWWGQAPKLAPHAGDDTPETWEHSIEVQLPFLQSTLTSFTLLPVLYGDVDPEQVSRGLERLIDDKTLVIASSDLSHYHPYTEARDLDSRCVQAICDLDIQRISTQEACGRSSILTLVHLARSKGWKARLLDCRNSGDVSPAKDHVVGYAAIAFYEPEPERFNAGERASLLSLARTAVVRAATHGTASEEEIRPKSLTPELERLGACFVTLREKGVLRGCIGELQPREPLFRAVVRNAGGAATRDSRFPAVTLAEASSIRIEISVATELRPLRVHSPGELLDQLRPHEDGVLLKIGSRSATFLPQVWSQVPDKVEFLNQLSQKAGCEPSAWKGKDAAAAVYQVETFEESE